MELTRNRRASGTYQYTYANPAEVGPRPPMQMEFWAPKGRKGGEWKVSVYAPTDGVYKTWRKVRRGHSHPDKLAHPLRLTAGYARDRKAQCELYTAWAVSVNLQSVAVFAGDKYSKDAAKIARLVGRPVLVADFIGDAPAPEVEAE